MTQEQGLQAWSSYRPTRFDASDEVAVLIQVPALKTASRRPRTRTFRSTGHPTHRRRRLRREIRWAGYALLAVCPFFLAFVLLGGVPSAVSLASSPTPQPLTVRETGSPSAEPHRPPSISITIEPAATPSIADVEAPVVFPGYLLPDDEREETPHAGS